jgi:hypothetical protein
MKKAVIILGAILLVSCSKSDEAIIAQKDCNCGLIISDNVQDYSVVIRNQCTQREKRFYLTQGDWVNAFVGTKFCISNVTTWKK